MDKTEKKEDRINNGRLVCQILKGIGKPATVQKIKSMMRIPVSFVIILEFSRASSIFYFQTEEESKVVSNEIRKVLRKGVNNGFLYQNGREYSLDSPKPVAKKPKATEAARSVKTPNQARGSRSPSKTRKSSPRKPRGSRKSTRKSTHTKTRSRSPRGRSRSPRGRSHSSSGSGSGSDQILIANPTKLLIYFYINFLCCI